MELSVRMHVLTMVGNSVVISASATKVSGIEERRVSVLRAVWLSKLGLRAVRSGRLCGILRLLSGVSHFSIPQEGPSNKTGVVG